MREFCVQKKPNSQLNPQQERGDIRCNIFLKQQNSVELVFTFVLCSALSFYLRVS